MNAPVAPGEMQGDPQRAALLRQRLAGIGDTDPRRRARVPDERADDAWPPDAAEPRMDRAPQRAHLPSTSPRGMRPGQIFAIVLLGLTLAGGAYVLTRAPGEQAIEPASVESFAGPKPNGFGRMRIAAPEPEPVAEIIETAMPVVPETAAEPATDTSDRASGPADPDALAASAEARILEAKERQRAAEAEAAEARLAVRGLKGDVERLEALLGRAERDKQNALELQARAHAADLRALRAELEARRASAPVSAIDPASVEAARLAEEARLRELERLRRLREAQIRSDSLIFDESRPAGQGITY